MGSIDIFLERMAVIVYIEKRPFSYRDFLFFEHEDKEYRYSHGTIRNIFSKLKKQGKIEVVYQAFQAFYTLKGVEVGKPITPNHGVEDHLNYKQNRFLQFLSELPMDKPAIHNIRLKFYVKGLWSLLSVLPISSGLVKSIDTKKNKDITLYDIDLKDHVIKTTVHRTKTVTVMVACSESPIPIDILGLAKLTSGLTRVEERLQRVMDDYANKLRSTNGNTVLVNRLFSIPNHMSWIVNMWHFGQDSLTGYSGEMFEIPWKDGLDLFRIYSKRIKNKKIIRKERQEHPNKPLGEAFMDKMDDVGGDD